MPICIHTHKCYYDVVYMGVGEEEQNAVASHRLVYISVAESSCRHIYVCLCV